MEASPPTSSSGFLSPGGRPYVQHRRLSGPGRADHCQTSLGLQAGCIIFANDMQARKCACKSTWPTWGYLSHIAGGFRPPAMCPKCTMWAKRRPTSALACDLPVSCTWLAAPDSSHASPHVSEPSVLSCSRRNPVDPSIRVISPAFTHGRCGAPGGGGGRGRGGGGWGGVGGGRNKNLNLYIRFSANFRPDLAPRPIQTGRAGRMVQNAPKINPGDQF